MTSPRARSAPRTSPPGSITSAQISATAGILGSELAVETIRTEELAGEAVTVGKIAEEAVGNTKIGKEAVEGHAGGGAVNVQAESINHVDLSAKAEIEGSQLAGETIHGGSGGNIAEETITGGFYGNIAEGTITSHNISPHALIEGQQLAEETVTGGFYGNIAEGTITSHNISPHALIEGKQLQEETITGGIGGNIAEGAITAYNIEKELLEKLEGGVAITPESITGGREQASEGDIAAGTIYAYNIAEEAEITGAQLAAGTVEGSAGTRSEIKAGTIGLGDLAKGSETGFLTLALSSAEGPSISADSCITYDHAITIPAGDTAVSAFVTQPPATADEAHVISAPSLSSDREHLLLKVCNISASESVEVTNTPEVGVLVLGQ